MNQTQQQNVITLIDNINKLDIDQLIIDTYPNELDFKKVNIGKYSASELKTLLKKMLTILRAEVSKKSGLLLPIRENFQNEWGEIILENDLIELHNLLVNKTFLESEYQLDKFIYFLLKYGFWNNLEREVKKISLEELSKIKDEIEINSKGISIQIVDFQKLLGQSKENNTKSSELILKLTEEFEKFNKIIDTCSERQNEIEIIYEKSKNKESEISFISQEIKDKIISINTDITAYKIDFDKIKHENNELDKQLNLCISNAIENLKQSKDDLEYIDSRKVEIENLTGMAADGALGTKFNQRQEKLNEGLNFWKWSVPIMTILAVTWVVIVFLCLQSDIKNEWIKLGVNLLKTSPAFILLGFVFKQYSKERNLEEEYAFKSAVAMTLTAYSSMLSEKDILTNKSRQEMLVKSIDQLYAQPIIHNEKPDKIFSFNSKNLKETLNSLTEAIKNIKST